MSAAPPARGPASVRSLPLLLLPLAIAVVLAVALRRASLPEGLVDPLAFAAGAALSLGSLAALVFVPPPAAASLLASAAYFVGAAVGGGAIAWALVDAGLLTGAAALGGAIGRRVQHPGHVLAASAIAAAADVLSISTPSLPTHAIARSERALAWLAVAAPVPGTSAVAPVLGLGDLVFASLVLAAGEAHGVSRGRLALAGAAGLAAAGLGAAWLARPVPALVALGGAFVALVPAFRRVRAEDRRATAAAVLLLAAALARAATR